MRSNRPLALLLAIAVPGCGWAAHGDGASESEVVYLPASPPGTHGPPVPPRPPRASAPTVSEVRYEPILRSPQAGTRAAPPAPPATRQASPAPARVGPFVVLRRPLDCRRQRSPLPLRAAARCAGEERAEVDLGSLVPTPTPLSASEPAEQDLLPIELASAWRTCPFAPDARLDALPDLFVAYEDRDVGRCYLWAPLDRAALAAAGQYDRGAQLATIHPYMRAVILRAIALSAAAGTRFRVISGARPGGKPSWHTFGLAVDVQIEGRKRLAEATKAFLAGGAEHDAWVAFADTAERLGLYWLGRNDPDEIFHFEWRPGWSGLPRGDVAARLRDLLAAGGLEAVWRELAYDERRPTAQVELRDPAPR